MISQTEPHGGEVFIASPPFFALIPKIFFLIYRWQVLRRAIVKERNSTQAWVLKLKLAGNNLLLIYLVME